MHRGVVVGVLLAIGVAAGALAVAGGQLGALTGTSSPVESTTTETPVPSSPQRGAVATNPSTSTPTPTPTATRSPTPSDPDRDNLPTRYEESIGTDPMHKTVLLAVNYTGDVEPLSAGDRSFLKAKFEELQVVNPDGTTGITLRIEEGWNTTANASVNPTALRQHAIWYHTDRTNATRCRHHYLVIGSPEGHRWGVANTGGWTAIVKSEATGFSGSREDVIVHELLHNLVGTMDPERSGVRADGTHTKSGWLQPFAEMAGPTSLHPASRERLNEYGFTNVYRADKGCV